MTWPSRIGADILISRMQRSAPHPPDPQTDPTRRKLLVGSGYGAVLEPSCTGTYRKVTVARTDE
jgi:hypothetical protein